VSRTILTESNPPFTRWADLAIGLPGRCRRTGRQIRDRWNNYLNPVLNQLPFSREDDTQLWNGHETFGNRWVDISVKTFHSTRSENHVKNRWYSVAFKKFVAKEFGVNLNEDAKRAYLWQQKCVGDGIDVVGGQLILVESKAIKTDARKEGGKKRHSSTSVKGNDVDATTLKKRKTNSERWTKKEEATVSRAIMTESNPPFTRWADLAVRLPGRTSKQIRDRWTNYMDPALNRLPFSQEDDMQLWNGHKELGNRWVDIGVKIFQSTRSENQIKNRWYSVGFKKFVAKEFGADAFENAKQRMKSLVAWVATDSTRPLSPS